MAARTSDTLRVLVFSQVLKELADTLAKAIGALRRTVKM